jgi:hypothetical protein
MQHFIDMVVSHKAQELLVLFLLSEGLALIPSVKANSVFQLIAGWLKKEHDASEAQPQA